MRLWPTTTATGRWACRESEQTNKQRKRDKTKQQQKRNRNRDKKQNRDKGKTAKNVGFMARLTAC